MWNGRLTAAALLVVTLVVVSAGPAVRPYKVCHVSDDEKFCKALEKALEVADNPGVRIECVKGTTRSKCLNDVGHGNLDVTYAEARDVYSAGQQYKFIPVVGFFNSKESTPESPYTWASIAMMRKGSVPEVKTVADLRGKSSCHTAVGRNMAWALPVSKLQTLRLLTGSLDCLDNVENVAKFFKQSCAPGSQDPFYNSLRQPISNLCKSCGSPAPLFCTEQDIYANYSGDFKALSEGKCDVAFSTQSMIFKLTANATEVGKRLEDFEMLCLDGTRKPVSEYKTCNWGWYGNDALVLSPKRSSDLTPLREALLTLEEKVKPKGIKVFGTEDSVFGNYTFGMQNPKSNDYKATIGDDIVRMMEKQTFECKDDTPSVMRWCTISPVEAEKCEQWERASISSFIKPSVKCVSAKSTEECMAKIKSGEADLLNVDGGDVYTAGKAYGLKPIMYENYGTKDATYFAVAVVKRSDKTTNFLNLKGTKSCHTGVGRTAGWNVPIATLIKMGSISTDPAGDQCRHVVPVSRFFSQSCAPGAKQDETKTDVSNLCALCKGEGKNNCDRSGKEPYFNYDGAFRCLVEGGGNVAFVNHYTVGENSDGKNQADWAKNLKSSDFELLCKDGTRRPIDQAADCNLAKVPSHAIVTAGGKTERQVSAFQQAMAKSEAFFVASSIHNSDDFSLYGPSDDGAPKDIIFRDGTKALVPLATNEQDYVKFLGTYITTAEFMDCPTAKTT